MDIGIMTYPAIIVICWLIGYGVKQVPALDNKWIPVIVGIAGAVVGLAGYFTGVVPAEDWLNAIVVGIVSGEASTGMHQVYKQLTQEDD